MSVSIIMPAYNVERYVKDAVESVLNQTYTDFELIICVNPSDDKTAEICSGLPLRDGRIKIVPLPERMNPGITRNIGLDAACGEYIYFMDSDDIIDKDTLKDNIGMLENTGSDMVVFGYRTVRFDSGGNVISDMDFAPGLDGAYSYGELMKNFEEYMRSVPYSVCSRIFRKSLIDGIRFESRMTAEDAMFNLAVLNKGFEKIYFNKKIYYTYRARPLSVMGTYNPKRFENEMTVLKKTEELIRNRNADGHAEEYILKRYVECFLQEYNNFTFDGCNLSVREAASAAQKMFDTDELRRAAKAVAAGEIEHTTARICYRLSLKGRFRAAVVFKRIYIPLSFALARKKFDGRAK